MGQAAHHYLIFDTAGGFHLADPGQGLEEENPSRLRANAHRLGCGRPARAVSIRGRVLEAPRPCADSHHHRRRSCASPRASGIGGRSRPRLSDCHVALKRANTVYGVSWDGPRQNPAGSWCRDIGQRHGSSSKAARLSALLLEHALRSSGESGELLYCAAGSSRSRRRPRRRRWYTSSATASNSTSTSEPNHTASTAAHRDLRLDALASTGKEGRR